MVKIKIETCYDFVVDSYNVSDAPFVTKLKRNSKQILMIHDAPHLEREDVEATVYSTLSTKISPKKVISLTNSIIKKFQSYGWEKIAITQGIWDRTEDDTRKRFSAKKLYYAEDFIKIRNFMDLLEDDDFLVIDSKYAYIGFYSGDDTTTPAKESTLKEGIDNIQISAKVNLEEIVTDLLISTRKVPSKERVYWRETLKRLYGAYPLPKSL